MIFLYSDELLAHMQKKNKRNIIVEVAKSDSSDFEITELHTHFVSDKQAELFVSRQGFHPYETEHGKILLPNYRLSYDPVVSFDIKKVLFFNILKADGIHF